MVEMFLIFKFLGKKKQMFVFEKEETFIRFDS
jgi:hypothetical protein